MPEPVQARSGVGELVRRTRVHRGVSQRALGEKAGLSSAYIYKLERGHLQPGLRAFATIAVALRMNPIEVWILLRAEALTVTAPAYGVSDRQEITA
jgi:transcriptional regulator with XRE-family HTH domain